MQLKRSSCNIIKSVCITVILTSCSKDFLENQQDNGVLLREEYVVDLATTKDYLNGAYAMLGSNVFSGYNTIYPELIADNIKPVLASSGTTLMLSHYNWAQAADNLQVSMLAAVNCNSISYACYKEIKYANFVIEASEKYKAENTKLAAGIKGQALALRAYCNFFLINVFAQPYNFTSDASHPGIALSSSSDAFEKISRSNVKDSYQSIIKDLENAVDLLAASSFDKLAFNKLATMALLSRAYLYSGDHAKAKDYAVAVIRDVPLMTSNYPEKLFTLEDTECLLELPPGGIVNNYSTFFASFYYRGTKQFEATKDIVKILTEDVNDKRYTWVSESSGSWLATKYPSGIVPTAPTPTTGYYQPVIRSSELYLTAAEAFMELNRPDSAIYYLDAIRSRANPSSLPTTATGNELKELIFKERRKELAFEGHRMFDLLRWKKKVVREDALTGAPKELSYANEKAIAPINTIDVNAWGIIQNTGY